MNWGSWEMVIYWLRVLAVLIFPTVLLTWGNAHGHNTELLGCPVLFPFVSATLVGNDLDKDGLWAEMYDVKRKDGAHQHVAAYSDVIGLEKRDEVMSYVHNEHPFRYEVDVDNDMMPDVSYIDIYGRGQCDDIVFERDLHGVRPDYDRRQHGRVAR